MRRFVLGALFIVTPFSGVRVICVDSPMEPRHPVARAEAVSDCERLCPLHPPSSTSRDTERGGDTENASDCALSVDGATMSVVAGIAVPQPQGAFPVPAIVTVVVANSPRLYVEPALAHLAPPPKQRALQF